MPTSTAAVDKPRDASVSVVHFLYDCKFLGRPELPDGLLFITDVYCLFSAIQCIGQSIKSLVACVCVCVCVCVCARARTRFGGRISRKRLKIETPF